MARRSAQDEVRTLTTDVLVIGSGGAGLRAAIAAHDAGANVLVIGKCRLGRAHTRQAEGGINAALGSHDPEDTWLVHAADTLKEAHFINDAPFVEKLCREAPSVIQELLSWGVPFNRTKNNKIDQRYFGAHRYRRTCFVGDRTGLAILNALVRQVRKRRIKHIDDVYVTKLLARGRRVIGAFCVRLADERPVIILAKAVVLSTGGCTRVYKTSTYTEEGYGDGLKLAYDLGAELMDMEMMQFHPTGMVYPPQYKGILVTEAVRGEGGILLNAKGERFMLRYDPQRKELGPRDEVARAIWSEIQAGRGTRHGGVWLDITHVNPAIVRKRLPKMVRQFKTLAGIDITRQKIEVAPTAHYAMGGIHVAEDNTVYGCTGLYAAGETTAGVHGANRLGGNSLMDILVFGRDAGENAAAFAKKSVHLRPDLREISAEARRIREPLRKRAGIAPHVLEARIRTCMWQHAGILRNQRELAKGLAEIRTLQKEIARIGLGSQATYAREWRHYQDMASILMICEAIIRSALFRKESRGAHARTDYPEKRKAWQVHVRCAGGKKGMHVFTRPVVQPRGALANHLKSEGLL